MKQTVKLVIAVLITLVLAAVLTTALEYVGHEWTLVSMRQVSNNMGDQIAIRNEMRMWTVAWWTTLVLGIALILLVWTAMYGKSLKGLFAVIFAAMLLTGCSTQYAVVITPPNYAIVIDMNAPTNQETGNSFGNGELVNLTQVRITTHRCAVNSNDQCPDKMVAQVQGAPESRIYTIDPNTGTSGAKQALCFEAQGINGCVDFSVSAIIDRQDARCYANKMGVHPVIEEDGQASRYNFVATPLSEALDTRVIQIAGAEFARATSDRSPLSLATEKFGLFEAMKEEIVAAVHDKTCITLTDLSINGGIEWSSPGVQETIDQATIVQNRLELAKKENEVAAIQAAGMVARTKVYSDAFGLDAAIRMAAIEKWDGSYMLPYFPPAATMNPSSPLTETVPVQ